MHVYHCRNIIYMFRAIWEFVHFRDCIAHSQNPEIAHYSCTISRLRNIFVRLRRTCAETLTCRNPHVQKPSRGYDWETGKAGNGKWDGNGNRKREREFAQEEEKRRPLVKIFVYQHLQGWLGDGAYHDLVRQLRSTTMDFEFHLYRLVQQSKLEDLYEKRVHTLIWTVDTVITHHSLGLWCLLSQALRYLIDTCSEVSIRDLSMWRYDTMDVRAVH